MQATFLSLLPTHTLASVSAYDSFLLLSTAPSPRSSPVPQVSQVSQVSQVPQVSEESVASDRQRFASTLFSLCKEMAFKAAKSILSAKKVGSWWAADR